MPMSACSRAPARSAIAAFRRKSCKGFYRALINRARIEKWNAEEPGRYFMSAEDLTTQAGVAVQQDLALATLIGATHVERNGHHYVDGMAGAPKAEEDAFLQRIPTSIIAPRTVACA